MVRCEFTSDVLTDRVQFNVTTEGVSVRRSAYAYHPIWKWDQGSLVDVPCGRWASSIRNAIGPDILARIFKARARMEK